MTASSQSERSEYLQSVLEDGLNLSKSHVSSWGRVTLAAIDSDDPIKLMQTFQQYAHMGADVNAQTTHVGYGGYLWTPWIHQFLGDTCLHITLKQRKIKCISVLLLMEVSIDIPNDAGFTATTLAPETLGSSLLDLRRHAMKYLLTSLPAHQFKLLPDQFLHRNIEREAWDLMRQGRLVYSEATPLSESVSNMQLRKDENAWRIQRDSIYDTIELLRRQVLRRSKIKHDQHLRESGLAAAAANALKEAAKADDKYSTYYKRLNKTAGFKHLKFGGWNQKQGPREDDDNSEIRTIATSISGGGTNRTNGGLADIESILPHRYITVLSTSSNLKYVHIGPQELKDLAAALRTDDLLTEMTISSACMCDAGVINLCPVIPTMSSLQYVDFSYNAITDAACSAIAQAIEKTSSVKRFSLRGNRITDTGAKQLIDGYCSSSTVRYLNLTKNRLSEKCKNEISYRLESLNEERRKIYDEEGTFIEGPGASIRSSHSGRFSPSRGGRRDLDDFGSLGSAHSLSDSEDSFSRSGSPARPGSSSKEQAAQDTDWKKDLHQSLLSVPSSPSADSSRLKSSPGRVGGSRGKSPGRSYRSTTRNMFVPMSLLI